MSRVGQAFLIDHGSGRSTLRFVVGFDEAEGWQLAVFESSGELRTCFYSEATLTYWCATGLLEPPGNVTRLS